MASIDLRDADCSVPIAQSDRKFLRFRWETNLYQNTCLPIGLLCAPRNLQKILKPLLATLHKKDQVIFAHIDDLYFQGTTVQGL